MKFAELLHTVADLPLFRGSFLLAGNRDTADVRRQLARWTASGKILQLRRDVYVLASPWRRVQPHPFLVANELHRPSYVSLQSALAHHGMIPEAVPATTSITTGRPVEFQTPLGRYIFRHVAPAAFFGFGRVAVLPGQEAVVADAAKALLDLVYLTPRGESLEHLRSLRLEDLDDISAPKLRDHATRWGKPKINRAVESILRVKEGVATEEAQS